MLIDLPEHLRVEAWPDAVIDDRGHDPRSVYVEWFWLPVLGPSTIWLLRRLAAGLDHDPEGFLLDTAECAAALGLAGAAGRNASFCRTLRRACQFHMARRIDADTLQVRRAMPPLNRHQVQRLPASLRQAHEQWLADELVEHRRRQPPPAGDHHAAQLAG